MKFYFEQMNKAWTTPNDKLLPPLYDTTCGTCANHQETSEEFVNSGERYASTPISIREIKVDFETDDQVFFKVWVHQEKGQIVTSNGDVASHVEASDTHIDTATVWKDGKWLLVAQATEQ